MKRPILLHPDPRLKKVCTPVADLSDDLRLLARDMLETMYDAPGIGLAAPQIGVLDRVIVLDCAKSEKDTPRPLVMINPQVLATSEESSVYEEGCLSIPDQFADVTRPAEVTVRWLDTDGREHQEDFAGLWATCVQHEIDHLEGKLMVDYLSPLKRDRIRKKASK